MIIATCMLIGALLGWIGFSFVGYNAGRSALSSMTIGLLGGFAGGHFVAPMFYTPKVGDLFSLSVLTIAAIVALVFLAFGNWIDRRWGM